MVGRLRVSRENEAQVRNRLETRRTFNLTFVLTTFAMMIEGGDDNELCDKAKIGWGGLVGGSNKLNVSQTDWMASG